MRFLKGLISTIKQMDSFSRGMFCGFSSMVLAIILLIPTYFIVEIEIIVAILYVVGAFLILRAFWIEDGKDDLKRFINKIKSNM